MFRKTKLSSAVAVTLAASVSMTMLTGLTGCKLLDSGGSAITSGSTTQITNPIGTVVGNVQDTNGNPLSGVTVSVAGETTTTDAAGNYRFIDLGVTNAEGADGDTNQPYLLVTVSAPAGYLGASVSVAPEAIFDGTNANTVLQNGTTVFVDGFIASAGTAVLPALTSTVTGILRNNLTEEPIANATISLDMEEVLDSGTGQEVSQDGISTGYQTLAYTTTTGADGSFTLANVPNDSYLQVNVLIDASTGATVNAVSFNSNGGDWVRTDDENISTDVGNILVTPNPKIDDVAPFVTQIEGLQDQFYSGGVNRGVFNDDLDGTQGIVIWFSEAMAVTEVDANSVLVYDLTVGAYVTVTTATMATDGMSMAITTAAAIPAGSMVDINFLRADFQDLSGNLISDITGTGELDDVGVDLNMPSQIAQGDDIYRLQVRIFQQINSLASAVTQTQLATDDTGTDDDESLQASNVSFNDVWDDAMGFSQLNSADEDAMLGGVTPSDAEVRLNELANALNAGSTVTADVTRVRFTPVDASRYEIKVLDEDGINLLDYQGTSTPLAGTPVITLDTNPDDVTDNLNGNGTSSVFELTDIDGSTSVLELVIENVKPGYSVEVTPYDDLNYSGSLNVLTLLDNVEPTTVIQDSYGVTPDNSGVVTSVSFGDGGELSNTGSATVGTPYLNVTPQLIDNLDADGDIVLDPGTGSNADDDSYAEELYARNTEVTPNTNPRTNYLDAIANTYDATGYTAMAADLARTIGVAMSEDVASLGTPTYTGAAAVSNYTILNDVNIADGSDLDGTAGVDPVHLVWADLVTFDVTDVLALAADDGATMGFAGMTDNAGNVAGTGTNANANVIIRDAMPPMVTQADYDGQSVTITFNERVVPVVNDVITIGANTITLTPAMVATHEAKTAGTQNVLTVALDDPSDDGTIADLGTTFNGSYADITLMGLAQNYTESAYAGGDALHVSLNTSEISDVNGNDWDAGDGKDESAGITTPVFAAHSSVAAAFTVNTSAPTAFTAETAVIGDQITFTVIFSHAVDMRQLCTPAQSATGIVTTTNLDTQAVFDCFILDVNGGGQAIDVTATGTGASSTFATYSGTTLTVRVVTTVDLGTTTNDDSFSAVLNATSDYNGADTDTITIAN